MDNTTYRPPVLRKFAAPKSRLTPSRIAVLIAVVTGTLGIATHASVAVSTVSDQVEAHLYSRIVGIGTIAPMKVRTEYISARRMLALFYERRMYRPAWSQSGGLLPQIEAMLTALREADREGLQPGEYHLALIEATIGEIRRDQKEQRLSRAEQLVDLDFLLTDAFLRYGSHLLTGRVTPELSSIAERTDQEENDLAGILQSALDTDQVHATLRSLLPSQSGYHRLREGLAWYRHIAARGGWPAVPDGPKMQTGDRSDRVLALRARLLATQDLGHEQSYDPTVFDEGLAQAVHKFQQRHGLDVDGIVGPATLAALNVSAATRVHQIELNLERWRRLPSNLGSRYLLVNITNFSLEVIENEQPVLVMHAIVGKPPGYTPVFSAALTQLVLNPTWNVPRSIAVKEMLPEIRKNPRYLAKHNFTVLQGWGAETHRVNPHTVYWSKVSAKNFPYRFRQEPGPQNALGRIKFVFPNLFDVYLHDTPFRELFAETVRTFSHGCIRLEQPMELAAYLLQGDPEWTHETLLAAIDRNVRRTIRLPEPLPVHLVYWTAWADQDGTLQFRRDIYSRDQPLEEALRKAVLLSFSRREIDSA